MNINNEVNPIEELNKLNGYVSPPKYNDISVSNLLNNFQPIFEGYKYIKDGINQNIKAVKEMLAKSDYNFRSLPAELRTKEGALGFLCGLKWAQNLYKKETEKVISE